MEGFASPAIKTFAKALIEVLIYFLWHAKEQSLQDLADCQEALKVCDSLKSLVVSEYEEDDEFEDYETPEAENGFTTQQVGCNLVFWNADHFSRSQI